MGQFSLFQDTSCTEYWRDTTRCIHDDHKDAKNLGMSEDDRTFVLGRFNYYRSQVEPAAKRMPKLVSEYVTQ